MSLDCWSDNWEYRCSSKAVEELAHLDCSESYSRDTFHVFRLADGKFVTVYEKGCSCYESTDADVELFQDRADAISQYLRYGKEKNALTNLDYIQAVYESKEDTDA